MNFYNDFDADVCAWIQGLIDEGLIPPGVVDQRSIADIQPSELSQYVQCHFFAGICGWPLALQLVGWPPDKPVGTGSCPCQPFSDAGKGEGVNDERHLWPAFFKLIVECRKLGQRWTDIIFGEQVASSKVIGPSSKSSKRKAGTETQPVWIDGVFDDLESANYACAAAVIPAAGLGAPHIRQRLNWVAYANSPREGCPSENSQEGLEPQFGSGGDAIGLGHAASLGLQGISGCWEAGASESSEIGRVGDSHRESAGRDSGGSHTAQAQHGPRQCDHHGLGDASICVSERLADADGRDTGTERQQRSWEQRLQQESGGLGEWSDFRVIECRDGKHRRVPVEPGLFPLVDAGIYLVPKVARRRTVRPALLKGAGNAIVPAASAEFVRAFMDL